jgi:hypothetical protein
MADITFTAAEIKPLPFNGAVLRQHRAGGTITVGHLVYLASDGDVERADGNVSDTVAKAIGIAVESYDGETTINSGDPVTVCVFGPVSGFASLTPGTILWVSDTVGRISDAAGTFDRAIGYAERGGIVFVNPDINTPSSA